MKIENISIERKDFELVRPYTIAFRTVTHVSNYIVKLTSSCGTVGLGAGSPEQYVTGENFEDGENILRTKTQNIIQGKELTTDLINESYCHLKESPAACAAVDIALWDLLAKAKGLPLCQVWGQKHQEMATSITIGIKDIPAVIEEAKEYLERGFKIIKLKLGKDLEVDIERTAKLRETVGDSVKIRVDANQGYTNDQTLAYFEKCAPYQIEFVEQPIAKEKTKDLLLFPEQIRKQIAIDEPLQTPEDAERFTQPEPWSGIYNIKLMKSGGLTPARKMLKTAENNGIDLMWGCMDESRISISAALHIAFSTTATKYIDLDGHLDLNEDVVHCDFELENGVMKLGSKPGLGCELL